MNSSYEIMWLDVKRRMRKEKEQNRANIALFNTRMTISYFCNLRIYHVCAHKKEAERRLDDSNLYTTNES
jgi:hypothetical protein